MKKFKVKVERVDEYIIEFDEDIINDDFIESYKEYFSDVETLEEHAENIAIIRARFGESFIEGYGNLLINGRKSFMVKEEDVEVLSVVAVFSYQLDKATNNFNNRGVELKTLSNYSALIEVAVEENYINNEELALLKSWRQDPENYPPK